MSDDLLEALMRIAQGRTDCGRPLAAETSRQIAREALVKAGVSWLGLRDSQRKSPDRANPAGADGN
jgi:hypothetical protein